MYFISNGSPFGQTQARRDALLKTDAKPATRRDPDSVAPRPTPAEVDTPANADLRMDGEVQAASLKTAAKEGLPFCAECEKRKAAAASKSGSAS